MATKLIARFFVSLFPRVKAKPRFSPLFHASKMPGWSDFWYAASSLSLRRALISVIGASMVPVLVETCSLPSEVVTGPATVLPSCSSRCRVSGESIALTDSHLSEMSPA